MNLFMKHHSHWLEIPLFEGKRSFSHPQPTNFSSEFVIFDNSRDEYAKSDLFLEKDIVFHEQFYDERLKTAVPYAKGTFLLGEVFFNEFLLSKTSSWQAILLDDRQKVILSGLLSLDSEISSLETAWIYKEESIFLRSLNFTLFSALKYLDFDSSDVFCPFNSFNQEIFIWHSHKPTQSLMHLLIDHYHLDFSLDILYLPYQTKSFVISSNENIFSALQQVFFEIGWALCLKDQQTLTAVKINIVNKISQETNFNDYPKISFLSSPIFQSFQHSQKRLQVEWASVKYKSSQALKAENRFLWRGESPLYWDENSQSYSSKPFVQLTPGACYPPLGEREEDWQEIQTHTLGMHFKWDIVHYDFWLERNQIQTHDMAIICIFDTSYEASLSSSQDIQLLYFKTKQKHWAICFKNTLNESFLISEKDDGIRNIHSLFIYGSLIYRYKKNFLSLEEEPSSSGPFHKKEKTQTFVLFYMNDKESAQAFFERQKTYYDHAKWLIRFDSLIQYDLNQPMIFESGSSLALKVVLISRRQNLPQKQWSYTALTIGHAHSYSLSQWSNVGEATTFQSKMEVRDRYCSSFEDSLKEGYVCAYENDGLTLQSADDLALSLGAVVVIRQGIYFLKSSVSFHTHFKVWEEETVVFLYRPSTQPHLAWIAQKNLLLKKNTGISNAVTLKSRIFKAHNLQKNVSQYLF